MTVKITSATFSACVTSKDALPTDNLPVVALVGRSNVGKSSLINTVTGRKELAKTSSLPGKTLTINFYCINDQFYIVDLPGYGYAKASKVTRQRIQAMMNEFFSECKSLKGVIQVLDVRHRPSPLDTQMNDWIKEQKLNFIAVLTKADKLSHQQVQKMRSSILKDLRMNFALVFSSKNQNGKEEFLDAVEKIINGFEFKSVDNRPRKPQTAKQPVQRPEERKQGQTNSPGQKNIQNREKPVKTADSTADGSDKSNQGKEATPGQKNNNRRRRWKNRKSSGEPRKDKTES